MSGCFTCLTHHSETGSNGYCDIAYSSRDASVSAFTTAHCNTSCDCDSEAFADIDKICLANSDCYDTHIDSYAFSNWQRFAPPACFLLHVVHAFDMVQLSYVGFAYGAIYVQ